MPHQPGKQIFEHRDGTQSRIRAPGNLHIDGKRAQQRYRHQNSGCDRGKRARREQRDTRLISESGKIIDARQPDDQIPRMGSVLAGITWIERLVPAHPLSPRRWPRGSGTFFADRRSFYVHRIAYYATSHRTCFSMNRSVATDVLARRPWGVCGSHVDERARADALLFRAQRQFRFSSDEVQDCRHRRRVCGQSLARREPEGDNLQSLVIEHCPAQNTVFWYRNLRLDILQESVRRHIVIVNCVSASPSRLTVEKLSVRDDSDRADCAQVLLLTDAHLNLAAWDRLGVAGVDRGQWKLSE